MEKFTQRERYPISSPEFLAGFREKVAKRLEEKYPARDADLPSMIREQNRKFAIDTWIGDACTWVALQEYKMREDEWEELKHFLFNDTSYNPPI